MDDKITIQNAFEIDPTLALKLNMGLNDIDSGRTFPHKQAMEEVKRLRESRRKSNAVEEKGVDSKVVRAFFIACFYCVLAFTSK